MHGDPFHVPRSPGIFGYPASRLKALPERGNSSDLKAQLEDSVVVEHLLKIVEIATDRCLGPTDLYIGPIRSTASIRSSDAILLVTVNCHDLKQILGYVESRKPDVETMGACLAAFKPDHINGMLEIESIRKEMSRIPFSFHCLSKVRSASIEAHLKKKAMRYTYIQYKF